MRCDVPGMRCTHYSTVTVQHRGAILAAKLPGLPKFSKLKCGLSSGKMKSNHLPSGTHHTVNHGQVRYRYPGRSLSRRATITIIHKKLHTWRCINTLPGRSKNEILIFPQSCGTWYCIECLLRSTWCTPATSTVYLSRYTGSTGLVVPRWCSTSLSLENTVPTTTKLMQQHWFATEQSKQFAILNPQHCRSLYQSH